MWRPALSAARVSKAAMKPHQALFSSYRVLRQAVELNEVTTCQDTTCTDKGKN